MLLCFSRWFTGDSMPEPKTMLEATAEANNLVAVTLARESYIHSMESACGKDAPFVNPNLLVKKHEQYHEEAIKCFYEKRKMGGKEFSEIYIKQLQNELKTAFENFKTQNELKNRINLFFTPFVLVCCIIFSWFWSKIFELIGILPLANLLFLVCTSLFIVLITYYICK